METRANIVEIFSSLQGEGRYVGEPMTFVRFSGCSMRCAFCDTRGAQRVEAGFRVETPPGSRTFSMHKNPVAITRLAEMMEAFDDEFVSITGGEPLEQADFLAEWLPSVAAKRRVLLETNGVLHSALGKVLPHVSVVSMDLKLPSSTRRPAVWAEHEEFLRAVLAAGVEAYVKIVVTGDTSDNDIQRAIGLVGSVNKYVPIFIQPAFDDLSLNAAISEERLSSIERLCGAYLTDVRVQPQMHRQWGVL